MTNLPFNYLILSFFYFSYLFPLSLSPITLSTNWKYQGEKKKIVHQFITILQQHKISSFILFFTHFKSKFSQYLFFANLTSSSSLLWRVDDDHTKSTENIPERSRRMRLSKSFDKIWWRCKRCWRRWRSRRIILQLFQSFLLLAPMRNSTLQGG